MVRTSLRFSEGRFEVRTKVRVRCGDCGTVYRPRVHAHAGLVVGLGFVAIALVAGAGWLWYTGRAPQGWFFGAKVVAALIVVVIASLGVKVQKRLIAPRFYSQASGGEPELGEIVPECPRCGSWSLTTVGSGAAGGEHPW